MHISFFFYKNYYIHADLIKKIHSFRMNLWYTFVWFKIRNNNQSLNSVVIDLQITVLKKNQYIFYFSFVSYFLIENIIVTSEKLFSL